MRYWEESAFLYEFLWKNVLIDEEKYFVLYL